MKKTYVLSSAEAEDMEVAGCTVLETTSWVDWWMFAAKSMALSGSEDIHRIKRLFVTGMRC